jgi:hypothetical protein
MSSFATEADVRLKFQLNDTTLAPSALITGSIEGAHAEILRFLDPAFNVLSPETALVMGETLLAGAHLFRSLASKDAFDQKQITVGGHRIDAGKRFSALMTLASLAEQNAWYTLEPYLLERPSRAFAEATDTTAVLGEE